MNTHSHQFLPLTRAEVSSEQTTGLASDRRADRCRRGQQRLTRTGQYVADRTFADRQREDLVHQGGQPFHADGMGVMQVDHQGRDRLTERRTGFEPNWRCGGHPLAAAGAAATEQAHLRHVRLDGRQFDALVDLLRGLCRLRERRLALRTGGQPGIDHTIRVRMQRPAHAGPALAHRTRNAGRRAILLLALRGWLGRVVRGLWWAGQFVEPRLQIRDACVLRRDPFMRRGKLRDQRQNQRVLLGVA